MLPRELFALNPDARVEERRIGRSQFRIVVVDDFYRYPDKLVALADEYEWSTDPALVLGFPGERIQVEAETEHLVEAITRYANKRRAPKIDRIPFHLSRYWGGTELNAWQRQPHTDPTITSLVFLTPDPHWSGGTGFYRHRSTGFEWIPFKPDRSMARLARQLGYPTSALTTPEGYNEMVARVFFNEAFAPPGPLPTNDGTTYWELMELVEFKFNRLVVYDGRIPHGMYLDDPTAYRERPRCFQLVSVSVDDP